MHVLADLHAAARARKANTPFLVTATQLLTYGELMRSAEQLHSLLTERDLNEGSRVLVITRDPSAAAVLGIGVIGSGRCAIPFDPEASTREVVHAIAVAEPHIVFADQAVIERTDLTSLTSAPVIPIDSPPKSRALFDRLKKRPATDLTVSGFPTILDNAAPVPPARTYQPEETALIAFTSGSSSQPKAVELSFGALLTHSSTLDTVFDYRDAVVHNILPLHHMDGFFQGPILSYLHGATLVRPQEFTIGAIPEILDAVYTHRVTHMITVPTILSLIEQVGAEYDEAFRTDDFRLIMSNAAPLGERLWARFEERFGVVICNSYGLTETVTSSIVSGPTESTGRRVGTIGKPIDCIVEIVDKAGAPVRTGETGEITIRGSHLFSGYRGQPDLTAKVFDGTTFRTGDIGTLDATGFVNVVGRLSRMILTGGTNVAPDEVDDVVQSAPEVIESVTVGLPDDVWGQLVATAVTGTPLVDSTTVLAHCRRNLTPQKVPRRLTILEEFPRTASGKIDALAVADLLQSQQLKPLGGTSVEETVLDLASKVFGVAAEELSLHSQPDTTDGWDSLAHMRVLEAVEAHWSIHLSVTDVIGIKALTDIVDVVSRLTEA